MATKNAIGKTDVASSGSNSDITALNSISGSILTPAAIVLANAATIDAGTGVGNAYKLRARATTGAAWIDLIVLTNAALAPTLDFPTGFTWNGGVIPLTAGGTNAATAAAALLNITGWTYAYVTGSDFNTSSTSLVDVTGLSFAAAANKVYEVNALLYVKANSSAAGVRYGMQFSAAGASVEMECNGTSSGGTASSVCTINALNTASANTYITTSGGLGYCYLRGLFITGANTGNITVRVLKVTGGNVDIKRGSFLAVRELTT